MSLRTVNIRALKDGLSGYLRDVQRGDVVLVSDRGRVVAELRQPTMNRLATDPVKEREHRLADRGVLRLGVEDAPPPADTGIHLADAMIDEALAWTRGDR
jgi:antitoxin (DNA-binding transcriptional repressor) of toxin-antitoxin stability system